MALVSNVYIAHLSCTYTEWGNNLCWGHSEIYDITLNKIDICYGILEIMNSDQEWLITTKNIIAVPYSQEWDDENYMSLKLYEYRDSYDSYEMYYKNWKEVWNGFISLRII